MRHPSPANRRSIDPGPIAHSLSPASGKTNGCDRRRHGTRAVAFARQSGGTAVIESEAGSGTTVPILLPRAAAAAQPQAGEREQPGPLASPQPI